MPTQYESDEARHEIPEPEGETLDSLPLRHSSGTPFYAQTVEEWDEEEGVDVEVMEPELLGPAQRSDRSWGSLAAAALLLVALLGAFLWYQRPSASPASTPPSFAPPVAPEQPAAQVPLMNPLEEPDAPPAELPQIIEELPAEPEPEPQLAEPAPQIEEPVQIAEAEEIEEIRPEPAPARRRAARPERPRSEEPARIAEASRPAPKRAVRSGPPESRMAGVLRPGPGVEMPFPMSFPSARYPAAARGRGLKVDVHLDILVDESGKVLEAVVREGDTSGLGFNEAAVDAALATRFQPATRWDLPGKAWTELIIQFDEGATSL